MIVHLLKKASIPKIMAPLKYCHKSYMKLDLNTKLPIKFTGEKQKVAVVTLNQDDTRNSLSSTYMQLIDKTLHELYMDDGVSGIVITNSGEVFAQSGPHNELNPLAAGVKDKILPLWYDMKWRREKKVVGAIHGHTSGDGLILVFSCDEIYATEASAFSFPGVNRVGNPRPVSFDLLCKTLGRSYAHQVVSTNKYIPAYLAWKRGIINRLYDEEILLKKAVQAAESV